MSGFDPSNPKWANSDTSAAALSMGHAIVTSHDKCHVVGFVIYIEKLPQAMSCCIAVCRYFFP